MVKNNVLTPVLAAILGVTVVGSGIGYYAVNKDGAKNDDKKDGDKLSNVAENINNTLDTAEKAIKGELDFAYDAKVKVSFGEGFTELSGQSFNPIELSTSTKQKGKTAAADFTLSYGDASVASVNAVYDREANSAYFKIPELSDAYVMANIDDAKDMISSQAGVSFDEIMPETSDVEFDEEAMEKSLKEYESVIKENLPEGKDGENVSGEIEGIKYDYTTKEYTITGNDVSKVVKAVLEKAKTDETMKSFYEDNISKTMSSLSNVSTVEDSEASVPTYEEAIDSLLKEFEEDGVEDTNESVNFVSYYNEDGEFAGFDMTPNGEEGELKAVTVVTDDACALDISFNSGDDEKMTLKGAIESVDGVANGSYDFNFSDSYTKVQMMFEVTDLKSVGDTFSGTVRTDVNFTDEESGAVSGWFEMKSDSDEDKLGLSFEVGMNGKSFVTVEVSGSETEASDITVPSGENIFDATKEDELNSYLTGCDVDGFTENLKKALGDELYNSLFGAEQDYSTGLDDYDYDYDYDDYDFDFDDEIDYSDAFIDYDDV